MREFDGEWEYRKLVFCRIYRADYDDQIGLLQVSNALTQLQQWKRNLSHELSCLSAAELPNLRFAQL